MNRSAQHKESQSCIYVVEWDDSGSPEAWAWYLANYPVVRRETVDKEEPDGRASTKEAAVEAATKTLPTLKGFTNLKREEEKLYESEQ